MAKKKPNFENSMERLEQIVELLERNDTPLDKSVELYKEGVELSVYCSQLLNDAQAQVMLLSKNELFSEALTTEDSGLELEETVFDEC